MSFLLCWSPIGDFRQNFGRQIFFSLAMATKMVAAWSAVLVQGPKITITVCQAGFKFYCGVLRWISFILNSFIRWTSKRNNFIFSMPTFATWYFCFPHKVCNMIPLFSQKPTKEDMLAFSLLEKNEIMLLTYEKNERGMILFHSRGKFSYHW